MLPTLTESGHDNLYYREKLLNGTENVKSCRKNLAIWPELNKKPQPLLIGVGHCYSRNVACFISGAFPQKAGGTTDTADDN